ARPAIVFDTVRRYLEYKGYEVDYVLNFTDVDDKIIDKSKETGESVQSITNRFIDAYLEDVQALGVKKATHHPRVTETMRSEERRVGKESKNRMAAEPEKKKRR